MGQIRFSIVVVCLNEGERLKAAIENIQRQTYADYEIIVKDGLSKDGSIEALPADERIRVYRRRDTGIYDAMNQAVEEVKGDYVYFLNCGDAFYSEDVLRRVAEQIEEHQGRKNVIFYGDIKERVTGERVSSNPCMDAFGCYRNVPCHQACFYSAELMRQKGFDLQYLVRADYEHFLWCFFEGKADMVYMPMLIADYEGGGFSETRENRKRSEIEHREIVKKYMSDGQVLKYRILMMLSLASLRTWISRNKATAHIYNKLKALVYKR